MPLDCCPMSILCLIKLFFLQSFPSTNNRFKPDSPMETIQWGLANGDSHIHAVYMPKSTRCTTHPLSSQQQCVFVHLFNFGVHNCGDISWPCRTPYFKHLVSTVCIRDTMANTGVQSSCIFVLCDATESLPNSRIWIHLWIQLHLRLFAIHICHAINIIALS